MNKLYFASHRGRTENLRENDYLIYENNIQSMKPLLKREPAFVEVDTRHLGDNTIILHHDPMIYLGNQYIQLKDVDHKSLQSNLNTTKIYDNIKFTRFLEEIVIPFQKTKFIIDVKDYSEVDDTLMYYNLLKEYDVLHRVILLSWNARFILDMKKMLETLGAKIDLGISFIPLSTPSYFRNNVERAINRYVNQAKKSVAVYNLSTLYTDKRLLEKGKFHWCLDSVEKMLQTFGADITLGFDKVFMNNALLSLLNLFTHIREDIKKPVQRLLLWDYQEVETINHFKCKDFSNINPETLVIFSSVMDLIDFKKIENKFNQMK